MTDASLFFVEKKGGYIRMIVDARQANQAMKAPPFTQLSSAAALGDLRLQGEVRCDTPPVGAEDRGDPPQDQQEVHLWSGSVDLKDAFHQFRVRHLGCWFTFLTVAAGELGVTTAWDDDNQREVVVEPDTVVHACYDGLPMGWSWALYTCHEIIKEVVVSAPGSALRWCLDKGGRMELRPGEVAAAPYVDNINILGCQKGDVQRKLQHIIASLDARGLLWHDLQEASLQSEMLGVVVDGHSNVIAHKPSRTWRLHAAISWVLKSRMLKAWQLRIYLGHFVHVLQLLRPALSILDNCYKQLAGRLDDDWVDVRAIDSEFRSVRGILPLLRADLGATLYHAAFMTDASMKGYAMFKTETRADELRSVVQKPERSRFRKQPAEPLLPSDDIYRGTLAATQLDEVEWDYDELLDVLVQPRRVSASRPAPRLFKLVEGDSIEPLPQTFVEPTRWRFVVAGSWRQTDRIHNQEGRASLMGLLHTARDVTRRGTTEVLSCSDNMSSVMAFEKGRSKNRLLLTLCRKAAALQLGCRLIWRLRHVDTKRNVADFMSRAADRGEIGTGQARHFMSQREWRSMFQSLKPHASLVEELSDSTAHMGRQQQWRPRSERHIVQQPQWKPRPERNVANRSEIHPAQRSSVSDGRRHGRARQRAASSNAHLPLRLRAIKAPTRLRYEAALEALRRTADQ
eukprot:6491006-Amphidinium_carterae.1